MEKVVVLYSGGQDSTVCLLDAIKKYGKENVEAISFIYNDEFRKDIDCAIKICKKLNVKHKIYDAGILHNIAKNNNIEGRNLVIISLAAIYAQVHNIENVMTGVTLDDIKCLCPHPDCSIEFIESLQETIKKSSRCDINIIAPLANLNKVDIWRLADELGYLEFVRDETFSCWISEDNHCMDCIACKLRFESLEEYVKLKIDKINIIDWNMFQNVISELSERIGNEYNADIIISIVRGGMIPSVLLSHKLGIREIENIIVQETKDDSINAEKEVPKLTVNYNLRLYGKKILLVDDILGSGETIRAVKNELYKYNPKELRTVVCYTNEENWNKNNNDSMYDLVDYIGTILRGWTVFPWEKYRGVER